MSKTKNCPICGRSARAHKFNFKTGKMNAFTKSEIVVRGVTEYRCANGKCKNSWMPWDQEKRILKTIESSNRFDLNNSQIKLIRECIPFNTKFEVANFLCFNEKAFTKWEKGYTEPNRAYDLLLRLVVFSHQNFEFVKHLHKTQFKFSPTDYQLICDRTEDGWNFLASAKSKFAASEVSTRAENSASVFDEKLTLSTSKYTTFNQMEKSMGIQ